MGKSKVGKGGKGSKGSQDEGEYIQALEARITAEAPPPGTNPLAQDTASDKNADDAAEQLSTHGAAPKEFPQLPISARTKEGLTKAGYSSMKEIQRAAIGHILAGRDVLGAAKTGSGKTLAFLVPTIEKLYRMRWTSIDGLGGLIISPTRELAMQIFQVLRKIGVKHDLSAGLIIGGKDVGEEQERIANMNILVCTPGRLLQHLDETVGFDTSGLQMLVLDEADRILDMGFENTVNCIIAHLPKQRQTLLFSATLSKSVKDLARLSLKRPEYIAVHVTAKFTTPTRLQQNYMPVGYADKLNVLWSFIKTHLKSKSIVFLSSCKQVHFVHEAFCRMRPGVPLAELHGKIKQEKRMHIFQDFVARKEAVLFATDIAARGLDFPQVDWVVQADCPEDVDTYIHRVGRTARNESSGRSLLLLTDNEMKMADLLKDARIPLKKTLMNTSKMNPIEGKLSQLLTQEPILKNLAQKALVSYLRSIHLQRNKEIFNVASVPAQELAQAWGLATLPRIRFVDAAAKRSAGGGEGDASSDDDKDDAGASKEASDGDKKQAGHASKQERPTKLDKLFKKKNADVLSSSWSKLRGKDEDESSDDELFSVKRTQDITHNEEGESKETLAMPRSKRSLKKIRVSDANPSKVIFDEEGNAVTSLGMMAKEGAVRDQDLDPKAHFEAMQRRMRERDIEDMQTFRAKQKENKLQLKIKLKKQLKEDREEEQDKGIKWKGGSSDEEEGDSIDDDDQVSEMEEEEEEEEEERPRKGNGAKGGKEAVKGKRKREEEKIEETVGDTLEDAESAALALLQRRRRM